MNKQDVLAFPLVKNEDFVECDLGMTLRDYFAAKAMASFINVNGGKMYSSSQIAEDSYRASDAMLKQREIK